MNENTNERYPNKPYITIVGQAACKMLYGTTEPPKEYEESGFSKRFKYNGGSYIYFFIPQTGEQLFLEEYSGEEENVSIPTGVTIIQSAVSSEDQFEEDLSSENSVKITPVFNMSNLKKITFPKTVLYIGENAIVDCQNLTEIDFSTSSPIIHNCAFKNCKNIEKVIMPSTQIKLEPDSMPFMGSTVRIFDFPNIGTLTSTEFNRTLKNGMNISPEGIGTIIMGIPLRGYPAATKVDSFIDLLLDKSMKGNDSNPCFSIFKGTSYLSEFDEEEQEKIIDYCDTILTKLLSQLSKDEIKENVLSNINHKNFMHNVKVMMDAGFTEDDIANIIKENNFNLLNTNIENAFRNYEWLLSQKILTTEVMDKFFFNGEKVRDINSLKEYYDAKKKKFPELFNILLSESDDKDHNALIDRLSYISTLELLDGDIEKGEKAKEIIKKSLFQSIVEYDQQKIKRINPNFTFSKKPKEFDGIYAILQRKMNGIDSSWFSDFFNMFYTDKEEFENFLNSLNAKKEWDKFSSEKERAEFLKNEIVARLLYADLSMFAKEKKLTNAKDIVNEYRNARARDSSYEFPAVKDLIDDITGNIENLFSNFEIVKAMLAIDPYSFDALREINIDDVTQQSIELQYVKDANDNGYYLSDEEKTKYKSLKTDLQFSSKLSNKTIIEYLCNQLDTPINDSQLIDKLEKLVKDYANNNGTSDSLYDICNILDFYLSHNKEYAVAKLQGNDFVKDSKLLFDSSSKIFSSEDEMPRVLYCLFNLNRLSKHDYDLQCKKWDEMRLKDPAEKNNYFKKINKYRSNISVLEENDIPISAVRYIYQAIKEFIPNSEELINEELISEESPKEKLINEALTNKIMEILSKTTDENAMKQTKDDIRQSISGIIDIYENYPEDIEELEFAAKEQHAIYECKNLFLKYIMSDFGILIQNPEMTFNNLNRNAKIDRFKKLGYAVELQKDENGELVLACYCKGIIDSFCVHLKGTFSKEITNKLSDDLCNPSEYSIATTQIPDRLRVIGTKDSEIDINDKDNTEVILGFNNSPKSEEGKKRLRNALARKNATTFGFKSMLENVPETKESKNTDTEDQDTKQQAHDVNDVSPINTGTQSAESTEPKNIQNNNGSLTGLDDTDIRQQFEETAATLVDELETGKSEQQSTDYTSASINISKR